MNEAAATPPFSRIAADVKFGREAVVRGIAHLDSREIGAAVPGGPAIGQGPAIGAGSLLTRDVRPHTVFAGSPARTRRGVPGVPVALHGIEP